MCATIAGIPESETSGRAFEMMDAAGESAVVFAAAFAIVNVVIDILDIKDVVSQTRKMVDELQNTIQPKYKQLFNGI